MNALPKSTYVSPEEYLLYENDRDDNGEKCEYLNGQVYMMAGASRNHNRVSMNFAALLFNHLKGNPCQVFQSDMKVAIQTPNDTRFYYPDVQVTCEPESNSHYNTAPCLIVEVLSNSTARTDRNEKLSGYRLLPSVQEYVLCLQDATLVEIYRRRTDWVPEYFTAGQTVRLESIGLDVVVDDLYDFLR
ncbi:MAG: Uma2 family endonuclease [Thiothrix sp.]|nr:Uma2 family endonuclease [Thiothrix sp.]HPQ97297.1 Uma2 family endonuclease [Thiolinea sp.]